MSAPVALVVGHATLDRAGREVMPGGSVYYAAHALAALGVRVRVLTAAGEDLPGGVFRVPLPPSPRPSPPASAGGEGGVSATSTSSRQGDSSSTSPGSIDALVLPSPATTVFENVYGADGRRTQRVHSAARSLRPDDLPAGWRDADLLLLAPVLGELDPGAFASAVHARAAGLCVQGLVREVGPDGWVTPRRLAPTPASLGGVGVAVLGEDEADGQPGLAEALAAVVPLVAFTRGTRGCDLLCAGQRTRHVGVHPTTEVDPTGAGDVFAAALLLALARGDDPVQAACLGAAAASIVVEGRGGETLDRVGEAWARVGSVPADSR